MTALKGGGRVGAFTLLSEGRAWLPAGCPTAGATQPVEPRIGRPRGLASLLQCGTSLFLGRSFPAPLSREIGAESAAIRPYSHRRRGGGGLISGEFPVSSLQIWDWAQRRVRYRLCSPPFSLGMRRLLARTVPQPEKSPRFRGVLAAWPRRIRTGDRVLRAWETSKPLTVSVARAGGPVSPRDRPSSGSYLRPRQDSHGHDRPYRSHSAS